MSSNFLVLINRKSPSYQKVANSSLDFIDLEKNELIHNNTNLAKFKSFKYILDLTYTNSNLEKRSIFSFVQGLNLKSTFFSDLTSLCPLSFHKNFPFLKGHFSFNFFSPENKFEYWQKSQDEEIYKEVREFFQDNFQSTPHPLKFCPHLGGNYPRVISMIINEAYFSIEEGLANKEDIDLGMKFGVNYPLGPFEWSQKIRPDIIRDILRNLFQENQDSRYKISSLLQIEANTLCLD